MLVVNNSEYIVFVDESGDHSIDSINERYPIFLLALCVFKKDTYINKVSPALGMLKLSLFGHDTIVLHEYEIRKKTGPFHRLGKEQRELLMSELNTLMEQSSFTLLPIIIDKISLKKSGMDVPNVYHLAMRYGLELLYTHLQELGQEDLKTYVVFEARGKAEDLGLEMEFRRVCDAQNSEEKLFPFEIVIADKKTNSCGLQFADLVARPTGLSVLRPDQPNRAFEILRNKLYDGLDRFNEKFTLPIKAKGLEVVLEAQTPVR